MWITIVPIRMLHNERGHCTVWTVTYATKYLQPQCHTVQTRQMAMTFVKNVLEAFSPMAYERS